MTGSVFESVEVIKNEVINFYEMYIHQERFSNVSFFSKSSVIPNYTGVDANNSIGFSRTTGVNNDINIAALNGNYSKAMTLVLDFYSSHVSFGDKTSVYYEALLSSRTVTGNGITLWYHGFLNRLVFDPGGHEYRTYYDLEENPARYLFVYTYGGDYNGVIIINKTTKKVLTISPQESNSSLIFEGFSGNDYEMSFGGESNQVHDGAFYQSGSGLKFYSFYLNDKGVTRTSLNELLLQFGYDFSKADISSIKS